jgi:hypothetical protein
LEIAFKPTDESRHRGSKLSKVIRRLWKPTGFPVRFVRAGELILPLPECLLMIFCFHTVLKKKTLARGGKLMLRDKITTK